MRDLRVGVPGRIMTGYKTGWFVEVLDDTIDSGGFLILIYENMDPSSEGYDSWAESIMDVDLCFAENGWDVEWID